MDDSAGNRAANSAQGRELLGSTTPPEVQDHVLVRRIGLGAYGEVWLARNLFGTPRAVKVVYRSAFPTSKPYEREFNGIQRFEPISRSHDGLINILQIGRAADDTYFYYVMELADAAPLPDSSPTNAPSADSVFDEATYNPRTLGVELRGRGRLPFSECLRLGLALSDALEHLHRQGLVHRDIKPSNIIFVRSAAKLADIGLVTDRGEGSWVGTEGYIPPEGPGTASADVYSLGKVLYEISTGKDRARFPEPLTALGELPDREDWREFNEVVTRACDPNQRLRYQSAADLHTDLVLLSGGKSVRRLRRLERSWQRAKYIAAAVSLLLLGGFITYVAVQARAEARTRHVELLRQAQALQSNPRVVGWRQRAWTVLQQAAAIRASQDVRNQTAAALAGLDARLLTNFTSEAFGAAFSRDGRRLLLGGATNTEALICQMHDLSLVRSKLRGMGLVASRSDGAAWQFSPNHLGQLVIQDLDKNSLVRVLELPTSATTGSATTAPVPGALAVSSDGHYAAAALAGVGTPSSVVVWNCETGERVHTFVAEVRCLAFAPDNSLLAGGDAEGRIRVWSLADGQEARTPLEPAADAKGLAVECLAFGRKPVYPEPPLLERWMLAAGDSADRVTLWDLVSGHPRPFFPSAQAHVTALTFSSDGTLLASGGRGPPILWDVSSAEPLLNLDVADQITALAFSPDGTRLVVTSRGGFYPGGVWILELENGRGIQRLRGLGRSLSYVCFDPGGALVAALAQNWRVGIWSVTNGQLLAALNVNPGYVNDNAALAFSPDGKEFAFSAGQSAERWDLQNWKLIQRYPLPRGLGDRLIYRTSGELLLSRQETLHDRSPAAGEWWAPANEDPRVFRVRNLRGANPTDAISTISTHNRNLKTALLSPSGDKLIIEGPTVVNDCTNRWLAAFDPVSGLCLWSNKLNKTKEWTGLAIDSTGHWLTAGITDVPESSLINADSGNVLMQLSQHVAALHGRAAWKVVPAKSPVSRLPGWSIFSDASPEPVLTILSGNSGFHIPAVTLRGNAIAWSVDDGTVIVCDLPRLRGQLETLGLGWEEPDTNRAK